MRTFISTLLCIISSFVSAQDNYAESMAKGFEFWKSGENQKAIAQFERIAQVEKENWIPMYYQAMILTTSAFQENDLTIKHTLITKASELLNNDKQINNAEWIVLQALCKTAELMTDPLEKSKDLSVQIIGLYKKAIALSPENPRALFGLAEFNLRTKKYFKQDTSEECEMIQKALSLFDIENTSVPFTPSWGKERAVQVAKDCK